MIFAPMIVNVGALKVNVLDHGSLLNTGPTQFVDHFISYKRNQGYGEQNGDFVPMIIPISYIQDADLNDSNAAKNSII
ncbi:hypothetical protein ABES03_24100 [Neobacillus rhizosphaerae]|uniref:hypothetical protein n=1 Tax=Neobacillus rhizosphaerae TaxID=2880965 RepID=UPI003D2E5312